jgi:hypothetical protein
LLEYEKKDHFQTLAGVDRTLEKFLIGIQTQSDYTANRHFYSFRTEYTDTGWWKPSVMIFRNYSRNDQWFQIKNSFELDGWKLILSYDNIHGGNGEGDLFGFYRKQDRLLVDASFTY